MARRTLEQQLAQLKEREKALKGRLAKTERANDTRRKVMLGALVLQAIETDDDAGRWLRDWIKRELPATITRDHDKAIFTDLVGSD